ncbi:conserved hypothetical protein [Candidatus Terasakiella magnetica]|nr:conserved hypothetical protein [Candidatus Terasakiella magnetica]
MISPTTHPGKHMAAPEHPRHTGKKPSGKKGTGRSTKVIALVVGGAIAVALVATTFVLRPKGPPPLPTADSFITQMESAAHGSASSPNLYGGVLAVERHGTSVTVTVSAIPPSICVSSGMKLVRKGLLTVNGETPVRVSAAKLTELCYQEEGGAMMVWIPKAVE